MNELLKKVISGPALVAAVGQAISEFNLQVSSTFPSNSNTRYIVKAVIEADKKESAHVFTIYRQTKASNGKITSQAYASCIVMQGELEINPEDEIHQVTLALHTGPKTACHWERLTQYVWEEIAAKYSNVEVVKTIDKGADYEA
ncbi:MAG: hypothetical protein WC449_04255 [Candidatus Paceibacterota bacterium]